MRVLFTELMETYRLPKYVDAASRKFIMATLAKHITRYRSFETYFAIPRRLYKVFKEQCGKVAEESIVVTDEIRCKYKSFGYHLRLIDALLRRVSPDVVVTANIDDFVTLALAYPLYSSRIKRVVWQDKSYYSHSKRLLFKTFRHSLGKRIDIVAARNLHSYRLVRELLGVVPELIPIGIDCEVYKPLKPTYSRSTDILFVGRASWEKGVDIFVETVLILDRISKHRIKVKIVTNGGPLEELFNLLKMRKLRRVVVEVKRNVPWYKMPEEYSDSLILVNTSRSEVFGQSMAEALACNTYVIATETPGSLLIKSFVREGIEIVKCASAKSIANRILEALHNYETPNSRKYICEYLSGEAMARKWAKLLSSFTT